MILMTDFFGRAGVLCNDPEYYSESPLFSASRWEEYNTMCAERKNRQRIAARKLRKHLRRRKTGRR